MKNYLYLRLLDRIKGVFVFMGVDYPTMRRILQLKLAMNGRRASTVVGKSKGKGESNNAFRGALAMYAAMGLFIGIVMLSPFPLFLKMNIVFGMTFFIILTTMISDFSSVLLDVQDKAIILTRPVDPGTLSAAKLLHIVYYLFCITVAVAGISLIAGFALYGALFFLTMLAALILICSFTILFTSILYFAVLRLFTGEKLRDIINYFQIALSVFMIVSYQLIGRMYDFIGADIQITLLWWYFLLPSSWFAAPFGIFFGDDRGLYYGLLALTGLVVPVLALILYIKVAAPAFERNLQKLTGGGGEKVNRRKGALTRAVSGLVCFKREERSFFKFTCGMLKSERKLKLRLFPNLTLGVIMPFIMLFGFVSRSKSLTEALAVIAGGRFYLYEYLSLIFFATLLPVIAMSENFRGAWIYKAMPVSGPGPVLKGALKAFIYKYIVPFYILTCAVFLALYGVRILPDLALIFVNMLILLLVVFRLSKKDLPFCRDFQATQSAGSLGLFFLSLAVCGGLAAAHYLLTARFAFGLALNLGVSLVLFAFLWLSSFRFGWKDIAGDAA